MIFYTILIHLLVISDSNIFKNILNSKKKGKLHKVEDLKFSPISTLGKINEKSDETLNPIVEVVQLLSPIISTVVWFYASKSLSSHLMNLIQKSIDIDTPSQNLPKNLIQFVKVNSTLSSYECDVLSSVITPDSGKVCLDMIGGIEDVKLGLWECIMSLKNVPSVHSNMIDSSISYILSPVKGALLFGPPGCGKTMLVHALGKDANLPIINITPSLIFRKWVGESNQLLKATFTLAEKLKPCIIFIDEMDSMFSSRKDNDQGIDRGIKTEFMQLWDTLAQENYPIFVVGASNMPESLDPAVQRRFERSFLIGVPNNQDRLKVLKILLKGSKLDNSFDFEYLSSLTEGYTPSDLLALCKAAVQMAQRDALTHNLEASSSLKTFNKTAGQFEINCTTDTVPPLSSSHFEKALETVFPTQWSAKSYGLLRKNNSNDYMGF